jgi:hypothetical protein
VRIFVRSLSAGLLALVSACATQPSASPSAPRPSARAPSKPVFLQKDLLGQKAASLDQLLGKASLVRREGQGEFRRYAFEQCTLIVILYPDNTGALAAERLDAAAKVSGDGKPDLDACLARGPAQTSS